MSKIKRRAFLKMAGVAVFSPSLIEKKGLTPGLTNPVDIFQDITGCPDFPKLKAMRRFCEEPVIFKGILKEIKINGIPIEDIKDCVIFDNRPALAE